MLLLNEIIIKDIIKSTKAISSDEGVIIYKKVKEHHQSDSYTEICFVGITLTTSAFLTSLITRLLKSFPGEQFNSHIKFRDVDPGTRQVITMVIERSRAYSDDPRGFKELAEKIIYEP